MFLIGLRSYFPGEKSKRNSVQKQNGMTRDLNLRPSLRLNLRLKGTLQKLRIELLTEVGIFNASRSDLVSLRPAAPCLQKFSSSASQFSSSTASHNAPRITYTVCMWKSPSAYWGAYHCHHWSPQIMRYLSIFKYRTLPGVSQFKLLEKDFWPTNDTSHFWGLAGLNFGIVYQQSNSLGYNRRFTCKCWQSKFWISLINCFQSQNGLQNEVTSRIKSTQIPSS